jgi:hypothetical protein
MALMTVGARNRAAIQFQELEELAKACFLVAPEVPRLGEHTLDHARGLAPVTVDTGPHEVSARTRPRTVGGDNGGDHRRQVINDVHDPHLSRAKPTRAESNPHPFWFPKAMLPNCQFGQPYVA